MNKKIVLALLLILYSGLLVWVVNFNSSAYTIAKNIEDEKLIFGAILTASAAILAISFTISQFTIAKIAKDYSPYLVKYYYRIDGHIGFAGFLLTIILSAAGLSITNPLPLQIHHTFILATIMFFLGSLAAYTRNFLETIEVINPLTFSKYIFRFAREELKKESGEAENLIISMGNTTLKLIKDGETRIARDFLIELERLADQFLKQKDDHDRKQQ